MRNGARDMPTAIGNELIALYNAGKWTQLVAAAQRVTARYPRNLFGWRASGKALLQLGKLQEAIDMLSQVVKLAPADADGFNDLGSAFPILVARRRPCQLSSRRGIESPCVRSPCQPRPSPLHPWPFRGGRCMLLAGDRGRPPDPPGHNNLGQRPGRYRPAG